MDKQKMAELLEGQLELLVKLNDICEPEQVRKNTETIFQVVTYLYNLDRKINL